MTEQEKKNAAGRDGTNGMPAGYEYDTLMNLLRVSVSKHLLADHENPPWNLSGGIQGRGISSFLWEDV